MSDTHLLTTALAVAIVATLGLAVHELRLALRDRRAQRALGVDETPPQAVLLRIWSVTLTGATALLCCAGLVAGALRWLAENAV